VTNLLNSIESYVDSNIAAQYDEITIEANGIWHNWGKAVDHLVPVDPVANQLGN
jgi:hypothetical protein